MYEQFMKQRYKQIYEEQLKQKNAVAEEVGDLEEGDDLILPSREDVTLKTDVSFNTKYEAFEVLGKGKFGVVKRCKDRESSAILAAKYIQKTGESKKETLREVLMMNKLHHKRLIQLYDAYETRKEMILVMELVSGGELFEKVVADDNLTEKQVVRYMKQVLYGLQHMHHKNMVHLDLKPENIMCLGGGKSGYEEIKLIDYGMTRILDPDKPETAACGTAEFVAPEVLQLKPISVAADMWGIGVITYVLLSGLSPFMGDDDFETLKNVSEGEYDFEDDDEIFENISQESKDFIEELLVLEPTERNTVDDALNHQWFRNFESLSEKKLQTNKLKKFLIKRRWRKAIKVVLATNRFANGIFGGIGGKGKKGGFLENIKQQVAKEEEEEAAAGEGPDDQEGTTSKEAEGSDNAQDEVAVDIPPPKATATPPKAETPPPVKVATPPPPKVATPPPPKADTPPPVKIATPPKVETPPPPKVATPPPPKVATPPPPKVATPPPPKVATPPPPKVATPPPPKVATPPPPKVATPPPPKVDTPPPPKVATPPPKKTATPPPVKVATPPPPKDPTPPPPKVETPPPVKLATPPPKVDVPPPKIAADPPKVDKPLAKHPGRESPKVQVPPPSSPRKTDTPPSPLRKSDSPSSPMRKLDSPKFFRESPVQKALAKDRNSSSQSEDGKSPVHGRSPHLTPQGSFEKQAGKSPHLSPQASFEGKKSPHLTPQGSFDRQTGAGGGHAPRAPSPLARGHSPAPGSKLASNPFLKANSNDSTGEPANDRSKSPTRSPGMARKDILKSHSTEKISKVGSVENIKNSIGSLSKNNSLDTPSVPEAKPEAEQTVKAKGDASKAEQPKKEAISKTEPEPVKTNVVQDRLFSHKKSKDSPKVPIAATVSVPVPPVEIDTIKAEEPKSPPPVSPKKKAPPATALRLTSVSAEEEKHDIKKKSTEAINEKPKEVTVKATEPEVKAVEPATKEAPPSPKKKPVEELKPLAQEVSKKAPEVAKAAGAFTAVEAPKAAPATVVKPTKQKSTEKAPAPEKSDAVSPNIIDNSKKETIIAPTPAQPIANEQLPGATVSDQSISAKVTVPATSPVPKGAADPVPSPKPKPAKPAQKLILVGVNDDDMHNGHHQEVSMRMNNPPSLHLHACSPGQTSAGAAATDARMDGSCGGHVQPVAQQGGAEYQLQMDLDTHEVGQTLSITLTKGQERAERRKQRKLEREKKKAMGLDSDSPSPKGPNGGDKKTTLSADGGS